MPIYRKGDDQFALRERAKAEPQGFKHPETVKGALDNPNAKVFVPLGSDKTPRVSENYHDVAHTQEPNQDGGWDDVYTSASYYKHREYPVSGSDIAKLKRGR